ncbi:MAG: luciferase family oxidoreductase group 1 [Oceanospirillaceae bacterium]|jgi:luciferase family oxidoreductase group 1
MSNINLTVLDQSPVHPQESAPELANAALMSIELAKACDTLGYSRYWVAEHHNSPQFAGPSPEILIASIASVTKNMRIGSGGVMLSHYSPYKVAEVFNMLNALFPERIDLGIGRAPGGDAIASTALAWPSQPLNASNYPAQAATLKALLEHNIPSDHPWKDLHITPQLKSSPQMWMLGSSANSAQLAGQVGMHLALARFISPDHCTPDIFDAYDQAWHGAGHSGNPNRMLALGSFCAQTQEEAELLAGTAIYRKMTRLSGSQDALLAPEEVQNKRKHFSTSNEAQYAQLLKGYTVGTPERCRTEIEELAKRFNTNEIAIVTVTHDFSARLNSYRLLAD